MLISVIVPTLNEEKYIEACLKSVKNQDYPRYEIIVSDSMSKDRTREISKKYARVIIANRGVSAGRNAGAKVAKGEILVFLDADTLLLPNTLTELANAFDNKHIVGATCPIFPSHYTLRNIVLYLSFNNFMYSTIKLNKPQVPGICCAYRKSAFRKVGGFDENIKTLEDFDLSLRIAKLGKVKFVESTAVITSHRRFEKWGSIKTVKEYLHNYSRFLLTGKSFGVNNYRPIR